MSQFNWNLLLIKQPFYAIVKDVTEKGSYFHSYARVSAYIPTYLYRYMKKMLYQFNPKISTYIEIRFVFFSWHFLKLSRHLKQFTVVLRYVGQGCENIELV